MVLYFLFTPSTHPGGLFGYPGWLKLRKKVFCPVSVWLTRFNPLARPLLNWGSRSRFEVTVYALNGDDRSEWRRRIAGLYRFPDPKDV